MDIGAKCRWSFLFGAAAAMLAISCPQWPIHAAQVSTQYQQPVGYLELRQSLGSATPTGQGITVSHVEGLIDRKYVPDVKHPEFSDTVFSFKSGTTRPSSHATRVGQYLYGNASSMSPNVGSVDNWEAKDWGNDFLGLGTQLEPAIEQRRIQNHSWRKASHVSRAVETEALRRFDYVIQRDNIVAVTITSNTGNSTVPALLAHNYNGITVGSSDGGHSAGFTRLDGTGRVKPDLVAPLAVVSHAAPVVSSAAAMLLETADNNVALSQARNSETVKAILLAGATKSEFSSWNRTQTRPLDARFGAGALNVARSYEILVGGEHEPSDLQLVGSDGWDFGQTTATPLNYFFEVPDGTTLSEFSTILTWNRVITDGDSGAGWSNPQSFLANLNLTLFSATDFALGSVLDQSISTVDNVEHIFAKNLPAGRYALQVTSNTPGTDFALAWYSGNLSASAAAIALPQFFAVPEPSSWILAALGGCGLLLLPRRRV